MAQLHEELKPFSHNNSQMKLKIEIQKKGVETKNRRFKDKPSFEVVFAEVIGVYHSLSPSF